MTRSLWIALLGLATLVGCVGVGDGESGTVLVRAGGYINFERGIAGQYYKMENRGQGYVVFKDLGRPQNPDIVLYPGHSVDLRGPMEFLLRGQGGLDSTLQYQRR